MDRNKLGIKSIVRKQKKVIEKIIISFIDFYGLYISPLIPTQCRYHPTCSAYMKESIEKKGLIKGIIKGILRILKCNPFFSGGYDPVK
ncbi:MAG TPA: membrane protein insertion efficiency factor YidD [Syntrophorhabdaceae bacterium]|nr:membrane protein insertion efficiency factor YidD [Syntrophorhabdaceae bacterium]